MRASPEASERSELGGCGVYPTGHPYKKMSQRLTLFYSESCPACVRCKPIWDSVTRRYPSHVSLAVEVNRPPPKFAAACKRVSMVPQLAITDAHGRIRRMLSDPCTPQTIEKALANVKSRSLSQTKKDA